VLIPREAFHSSLHFRIPAIIHVDDQYLRKAVALTCYEDVNCEEAGLFPLINDLKRSAAWLMFFVHPNYYICSGSLLNDTRDQDFQPFLLTARHCINSQAAAASLEARFDHYTTSCNGPVNAELVLVNGSNLVATGSSSDFSLLLLHHQPGGDRVYLGWNTTALDDDEVLHSVHHPGGMPQQYSRHQNKYAPINLCTGAPLTHYYYTRVQAGQLSGGSSGGTLVKANGQAAGQLRGACLGSGYHPCNYSTYYNTWGRFEVSYAESNLQYWLAGGGAETLIAVSHTILDFGETAAGSSIALMLDISNTGNAANHLNLEVMVDGISGNDADDYFIDLTGGLYLPPGSNDNIPVIFAPATQGIKTATLTLWHNADNMPNPLNINLAAEALPPSDFLFLGDIIISSGESNCYAAAQNITVAGDGAVFIIENGGNAELVAGESILLKEGSWIKHGAEFVAWITNDGNYCQQLFPVLKSEPVRAVSEIRSGLSDSQTLVMNIFPNPASGSFTVEFVKAVNFASVRFEIYTMHGKKIADKELPAMCQFHFNLSGHPTGIYLIRVMMGDEVGVEKLIKR